MMRISDVVYEHENTRPMIGGTRSMVVSGHYLASQAGFTILEAGGNAVDAAVAGAITEAIVQPEQVNFAGIAPSMLYWAETGEIITLPGVGCWPRATDPKRYAKEFASVPEGLLRTVIPAAPATHLKILERYGTMSFGDVAGAAIRLARDGFALHPFTAGKIAHFADDYRRWPSSSEIFLPGGQPPSANSLFRQTDLAKAMQYMADEEAVAAKHGRAAGLRAAHDAFYRGDIAKAFGDYHADNGGYLSVEDMADFEMDFQPGLLNEFEFGTLCTMGFDGQGPMMAQAMRLIEQLDTSSLTHNSVRYIHMLGEVLKLSFSDRESYFGDPRFIDVPGDTLRSTEYARQRIKDFRWDEAWPEMPPPGTVDGYVPPLLAPAAAPGGNSDAINLQDTSFVAAMDRYGNLLAISPSDASNDTPVIPGTGMCPSSRGAQSRPDPSHPSSIKAGKRPRATPNPLIIMKEGRPQIALGTPGADAQPQANLQVLMNIMHFGMTIQDAVEAPRFCSESFPASFAPHTNRAGVLKLEQGIGEDVASELTKLGHIVEWWPELCWRTGGVCVIQCDDGMMRGAADPRRAGYALGW